MTAILRFSTKARSRYEDNKLACLGKQRESANLRPVGPMWLSPYFKPWFVDFNPVRAQAAGRDPGLPQPLADLFPDLFEGPELGEIPRGWKVGPHSIVSCCFSGDSIFHPTNERRVVTLNLWPSSSA